MENLKHWNKICRPPEQALKKITAGRLKGKSDINPQWRIKAMTEEFGPVGFGWTVQITRQWSEQGSGGQLCAFANVAVKIKVGEEWSEPFHGTGGSMLVAQESKGPHTSDECYKMAVTDAISTALKLVGVAADIYMGMFDGSKYTTPPPEQKQQQPDQQPQDDGRPNPQTARNEYKVRAEAAISTHAEMLASNPDVSEWVNAAMEDGNYNDVVNYFNQNRQG